jgi:transcriptional regulator with PAS, ATPase and Fis domain
MKAQKLRQLAAEGQQLKDYYLGRFRLASITTQSPAMIKFLEVAALLSQSQKTTVMIQGESGVGKEVLARVDRHGNFPVWMQLSPS